jgi:hypothetical protein
VKYLSETDGSRYIEFYTSELAYRYLKLFLSSYPDMDALRKAHPRGLSIIAPGEHCYDSGKSRFEPRIIFSSAESWTTE